MATYKGIQGYSVQSLSSDPSPTASVAGQLWYNSTSGTYKIAIAGAGAWASGGAINAAGYAPGGLGIQTAAMKFGGKGPSATSETYNGTAWSEGGNLGSSIYGNCGFGTTTAGVNVCGAPPTSGKTVTEEYDGTSWSVVNPCNTGRYLVHGIGSQTAGIIVGGAGGGQQTAVEKYDGTNWTATGSLNTARGSAALAGTSTATLASGGGSGNGLGVVESFDGTSWSEMTPDLNSDRANPNGGGALQTAALIFGGTSPPGQTVTGKTEKWNGTTWTETGDLATPRELLGAAQSGPSSVSLAFTGVTPGSPVTTATEEWNDPVYAIKTVTVS